MVRGPQYYEMLKQYINQHIEEFKNGITSDDVDKINIPGLTKRGIQLRLNKLCNHCIKHDGKREFSLYRIKEDYKPN